MAKLLYDYWFVQYDFPLSAAQAAALGKPRLAGQPYRTSGGKMVFNPTLKREIPEGWEVRNLSELCHLNHRTWPNKDHPDQVTYLDLANAKNGEILSVQNFAWDESPSRARRILTPGDTIIGTVRPGNRSFALVPNSQEILTGSTGFAVLTPKSAIYREFNYLSLTSESNINRLTTVASGAAYPAVNPEVAAAQSIALPDAELIQQFHQTTASFFDLIERHRAQNQELTTLRDWLLPMLMNGQVRVG
jgi:type I restriction enzyme S subunit